MILLQTNEIEVVLNCLSFTLKLLSTKKDSIRIRIANMFSECINNLNTIWRKIGNIKIEELSFMISAYFSNITTSSEVRKQLKWDEIVVLLGSFLDGGHQDIQFMLLML